MKIILLTFLAAIIFLSCNNNNFREQNMPSIDLTENIKYLQKKNIYFGHQSVGSNILDGIRIIFKENDFQNFNINKYESIDNLNEYYFIHSKIGKNGNPKSKIDEFCKVVETLSGKNLDVAIFKLCFVDIDHKTNINEIFEYYNNKIDSLQKQHPGVTIINMTVPLTTEKSWWQKLKESIRGNKNEGLLDNLHRNRFNKLLLSKYPNNTFDLARIESTYQNGKREVVINEDEDIYYLIEDFSDDGGHLNDLGKKVVAEKMIEFVTDKNPNSVK